MSDRESCEHVLDTKPRLLSHKEIFIWFVISHIVLHSRKSCGVLEGTAGKNSQEELGLRRWFLDGHQRY
jgi:hypothetical protein